MVHDKRLADQFIVESIPHFLSNSASQGVARANIYLPRLKPLKPFFVDDFGANSPLPVPKFPLRLSEVVGTPHSNDHRGRWHCYRLSDRERGKIERAPIYGEIELGVARCGDECRFV